MAPQALHASSITLTWVSSATGERFPIGLSSEHPLWKSFLESGCLSPTTFFRAFQGAPKTFPSPTPWQNHRRLAQKVSELLDQFRPGWHSYRPFGDGKRGSRNLRSVGGQRRRAEAGGSAGASRRNSRINDTGNGSISPVRIPLYLDEASRHRLLYIDLGRPRPFYRVLPEEPIEKPSEQSANVTTFEAKSLQELAKVSLLKCVGLSQLRDFLLDEACPLPEKLRESTLTFLCSDFEEMASSSQQLAPGSTVASYQVRCAYDGQIYKAVFVTSELDQNCGNLWRKHRFWLQHRQQISTNELSFEPRILALAVDPLTENIFFILPADEVSIQIPNRGKDHVNNDDQSFVFQALNVIWNEAVIGNPLLSRKFREMDVKMTDKHREAILEQLNIWRNEAQCDTH